MTTLQQITAWPVANAAAVVVGPGGVLEQAGDAEQVFGLASLTKTIAALATLVAVEEGALELDSALGDESLQAALPEATLAHLLAHASGIAPDRRERAAAVGTRRIYSNAGFEVAGELVTRATSIDFGEYVRDAVFRPLGMGASSLTGSPASGAASSVADMARYAAMLLAGGAGLLHPSTFTAASTVQFPGLRGVLPGYGVQQHNDWALGFEIRADKRPHWTSPDNSPATFGHFGRSGTMIWVDPAAQVALVALTDRAFDDWAITAWPALSTSVLQAYGR